MSIVIVRHGETALNRAKILQPLDTPLGAVGVAQAQALAARLVSMDIRKVVCSDLPRARMTAAPLLQQKDVPAEYWPELRERSFGDLLGRSYADVPDGIFEEDYVPTNGESSPHFRSRVARAWARIVQERASLAGALLVVTHNLVCCALSDSHLAFPDSLAAPKGFANTSVTIAAAEPPHRVTLVNCVRHL